MTSFLLMSLSWSKPCHLSQNHKDCCCIHNNNILSSKFYALLTMRLGIILFNDQLDAQFLCICLLQFSTCFEHSNAHHQEIQLYQYDILHMSLYVVTVCYADLDGIDTIDSPDDIHMAIRNTQIIEINICKKKKRNCASSGLFKKNSICSLQYRCNKYDIFPVLPQKHLQHSSLCDNVCMLMSCLP